MDLALVVPKTQAGEEMYGALSGMLSISKNLGGKSVHLLLEQQPQEAYLDERDDLLEDLAIEVNVIGNFSENEILAYVEKKGIDLLVIDSSEYVRTQRNDKKKTLRTLFVKSTIPILLFDESLTEISTVLFCEGGADEDSHLRKLLVNWTQYLSEDLDVTVFHVLSQISAGPGVQGWELRANAEEIIEKQTPEGKVLKQDLEILSRNNVVAKAKVRHGLVLEEIKEEIQAGRYDLVIIGAHPKNLWRDSLLEDLSWEIIKTVQWAILVVPFRFGED